MVVGRDVLTTVKNVDLKILRVPRSFKESLPRTKCVLPVWLEYDLHGRICC